MYIYSKKQWVYNTMYTTTVYNESQCDWQKRAPNQGYSDRFLSSTSLSLHAVSFSQLGTTEEFHKSSSGGGNSNLFTWRVTPSSKARWFWNSKISVFTGFWFFWYSSMVVALLVNCFSPLVSYQYLYIFYLHNMKIYFIYSKGSSSPALYLKFKKK